MRKAFNLFFLTLIVHSIIGQTNVPKEYTDLVKQADSLYKHKDYSKSAVTYSKAFSKFGWKGFVNDRFNAACSWALAGNPDSAFYQLEKIVSKANYPDFRQLSTDSDLFILHNDSRWLKLLELVKQNKEKAEFGLNKPLLYLLDSLVAEDQKWRRFINRFDNKEQGSDTISRSKIIFNMCLADSLNYFQIKFILKKYGFPNYDKVGVEGSNNFWLLIQHQDKYPEFQDSVLTLMKSEVDKGKVSSTNYAYLLDRVKINTGQLQIYGTQMELNNNKTSYIPLPVIEPEKLNERRKSVGLGTIEEYIKIMNNRYFGTLKIN